MLLDLEHPEPAVVAETARANAISDPLPCVAVRYVAPGAENWWRLALPAVGDVGFQDNVCKVCSSFADLRLRKDMALNVVVDLERDVYAVRGSTTPDRLVRRTP